MTLQAIAFADLFTATGGANGTAFNSLGLLVAQAAPALDYDPVSKAVRGLAVRRGETNLLLRSSEFDNAAWSKSGATVTANATTAPDGTTTADKLIYSNGVAGYVSVSYTFTAGVVVTDSVFMKSAERTSAVILVPSGVFGGGANGTVTFDLSAGTAGAPSRAEVVPSIEPAGNGWYRCHLTSTPTATLASQTQFGRSVTNGNGTDGIFIWGGQRNVGGPTGYIPTVASTVTRTADAVKIDGTRFAQFFRQGEGTVYVQFRPRATQATGTPKVLGINDGTAANAVDLVHTTGGQGRAVVTAASVSQADIATGTVTAAASNTLALSFRANDVLLSVNGAAAVADTSASIPATLNQMLMGDALDGWLQDVVFIPKATPASELPALGARIAAWRASNYRVW